MARTTRSISVDVEIDLASFDAEDLQAELVARQETVLGDTGDLIARMWTAFYTGKDAQAMTIARQLAELATGRLVPQPKGAQHGTAPQT